MVHYGMDGRVAIVTGGSGGLGKAVVQKFLESGARVIFTGRGEERGQAACQELSAFGEVEFCRSDVSKEEQVRNLIAYVAEKYGRLDYVVNNAAGFNASMPLHEVSTEDFRRVLDTDVLGVFYMMKYAAIQMLTQESGGSIVNISSCTSQHELPGLSPYQAAKHAVNGLTRTAAKDYCRKGIRVNAVLPGMIDTEAAQATKEQAPEIYKMYQESIPTGHISTPREIANAVVYLCSDDAHATTGALFVVDEAASI